MATPRPDKTLESNSSPKPAYSRGVPAVAQASQILFHLAGAGRTQRTLTEICREVGIHKSKGYAILNTMAESGLVARDDGAKTYALGPGLLVLSRSVLDHSDLRGSVVPFLERLSQATGCTALLGLINSGRVLVVAKHEPEAGMAVAIRVGHRYPLTWGAHGKAMVAFLEETERRRVLADDALHFWGEPPRAAEDPAALDQELAGCRVAGYATDLGGVQAGVNAASSPVLGSAQTPIGAVMAVGTFPLDAADQVGREVAATAQELSTLLGPTLESLYGAQR